MTQEELNKIQELQRIIERDFGTRCDSFDLDCFGCRVWLCYDLLTDLQETYDKH